MQFAVCKDATTASTMKAIEISKSVTADHQAHFKQHFLLVPIYLMRFLRKFCVYQATTNKTKDFGQNTTIAKRVTDKQCFEGYKLIIIQTGYFVNKTNVADRTKISYLIN